MCQIRIMMRLNHIKDLSEYFDEDSVTTLSLQFYSSTNPRQILPEESTEMVHFFRIASMSHILSFKQCVSRLSCPSLHQN